LLAGFGIPCSAMLHRVDKKPTIAIIGPGNLGAALAVSLRRAGYDLDIVVSRRGAGSLKRAEALGRELEACAYTGLQDVKARVLWFCVPDSQIAAVSSKYARQLNTARGSIALHSSGALASDELQSLRKKGAAVASVHPMMTFVRGSRPSLAGIPFALEGDAAAVKTARRIVLDLGAHAFPIRKKDKAAYHAWGAFASPLLTSLLRASERVAEIAGVDRESARRRMIPILLQTLANYASFGAAGALSGPIVRGDVETVRKHLKVLRPVPAARDAYLALAQAALEYLPAKNKSALKKLLAGD